ncbi:methyltransferase [Saccharothrix yanglingensis]|uniref:Methyltransferase n=1 Tax=Saccharothrix yanglingensis TaxID=659496 RepID=A0ABU0X0Y0_9PSEU|nr:methyltransferase [Saccharothrix yanglingensis]MDQ2585257.1 methyltransferase [Saccharothrix yanglingensis]
MHVSAEELPPVLPAEHIIAINQPKRDLHTERDYTWNGMGFRLPPGVFHPGETSRMLHRWLLDGDIETRGKVYAAMGVGAGVEAVAAGLRGAGTVYALDVHPASVEATDRHYATHVGDRSGTRFRPLVSDLFSAAPDGARLDVVTFNPPAVSQTVSDDPDVVRNVCVGAPLVTRFFDELVDRDLLAPDGEVLLIVSNTADLRTIIGHAELRGFTTAVRHRHDWHDGVVTFLFGLTRGRT